jgi:CBS domain-containing protein
MSEEAIVAEITVRDIMRTDVPSVAPDDSVARVALVLSQTDVSGVPVLENGEVVGIVSESDIIERQALPDLPTFATILDATFSIDVGPNYKDELRHVLAVNARELMTAPVYNLRHSATLDEAATLMVDRKIGVVPVLGDDGELIGVVTRSELVRTIAKLENADSTN